MRQQPDDGSFAPQYRSVVVSYQIKPAPGTTVESMTMAEKVGLGFCLSLGTPLYEGGIGADLG
jgi:hypothetical protein